MANVQNFHILPEQEELFYKACSLRTGWWGDKIDKKKIVYRKRNFKNLVEQSYFPDISAAWNSLTAYKQGLWNEAGQWAEMSGWDLFAQDMSYRLANNILGIGEANLYHQFMVGKLTLEGSANDLKIRQNINLGLNRQLEMAVNFISRLTPIASPNWVDLYLYFEFYDAGEWVLYSENLSLDGSDQWYYSGDYYDLGSYQLRNMYLQIEIHNMQGSLFVDGITLIGQNSNLVTDWQFDNIQSSWTPVNVPSGASYESVYWRNDFYNL